MISMYTKQEIIIRKYREGESQRSISRALGISRKTVKKYIDEYEKLVREKQNKEEAIGEYMSRVPEYRQQEVRSKRKLTNEVQEIIDGLLEENRKKLSRGLHKQILKKRDILEEVQRMGYQIGYTTVCNYIREREGKNKGEKESYIRQTCQPGESCEFDWGEVRLVIAGKQERFYMSVFTSAYSNYRYAGLSRREDTLSFEQSHVDFFAHSGGSWKEIVYDNTRVAVARFTGKKEKEPTAALLQLRGYYRFTHRFCNAYRGNEKGHVERSVEYIRRKAFGLRNSFDTLKQACQHLERVVERLNDRPQQLTGKTAKELFLEEKGYLWPAPVAMTCSESREFRVDKYSTISYATNRYSVPERLTGKFVRASIYSDKLELYYERSVVAVHERSYGKHQWIINIEHYLDTFKRKPGALKRSVALARSNYLKDLYEKFFFSTPRAFIELLHYCHRHQVSGETLEGSVARLLKSNNGNITTEMIMALLGNKPQKEHISFPHKGETVDRSREQLQQINQLL